MKIAIFHMNQLGDMLFSLPMIYNLRETYKEAEIISILKSSNIAEFIELTSLINKTIKRPPLLEKLKFIKGLKSEQFDLSIHISQSIDATLSSFFANIPQRIGFDSAGLSFLYTKKVKFKAPPSTMNNLRLLECLNIKIHKTDYVGLIKIKEDEKYLKNNNINSTDFVVVISPGSSKRRKFKRWKSTNYAEIIKYLIDNFNAKCFLTGIASEYELCNKINLLTAQKAYNLAGKTSLKQLTILLGRTNLFIGVDSGAMHLASALDKPVIALYGSTEPSLIGPQGNKKLIIKKEKVDNITIEDVKGAIKEAKAKNYI